VDHAAVRAEFDNQLRRNPAAEPGALVEREPRVTRIISGGDGWSGVLWSDLTEAGADAVIGAQVSRFAELGRPWEWKYYSYDQPAGLPGRLEAAGFAPEPAETLLVAQIADLDVDVSAPAGVELVPVTDASGVAAVVSVHDEVFGGEHAAIGSAIMAALASRPRPVEAVVAVAEGRAVSAGRVEFPEGSDFASLWGGGTRPGWRGRGVFRSLVAYRARLARDRGYRYLQVDASADSSPILQRLGFAELARTTPFLYVGTGSLPGLERFDPAGLGKVCFGEESERARRDPPHGDHRGLGEPRGRPGQAGGRDHQRVQRHAGRSRPLRRRHPQPGVPANLTAPGGPPGRR
jgi:GNAT superfamily N-acetyltransferase